MEDVDPQGDHQGEPIDTHVFVLEDANPNRNFLAFDENAAFIWLEKLLKEQKGTRNAAHLRCYHNNTSRSVAASRMHVGLLGSFSTENVPAEQLKALTRSAIALLDKVRPKTDTQEKTTYVCAGQVEFVRRPWVATTIEQSRTLLSP